MTRIKGAVKETGAAALVHGNRGRQGNRRIPEKEKEKIIRILKEKYPDFPPTHAKEKLEANHNIFRAVKTIRGIMTQEKLWQPKKSRKKSEHRQWRQRKSQYGEMQQFDGSYHAWFEERIAGRQCLLLSIDDATGQITKAKFDDHEGVFPVFDFWREYLLVNGRPRSIYTDKFSTYKMNQQLAKENADTKTQFQRALNELQIEPIFAHSPQAKGRVEKVFNTLQNRLVKEMRLKNIGRIQEANRFLADEFIPGFNQKFAVGAMNKGDAHRRLLAAGKNNLDHVFSRHEHRVVQNDFTISYKKQWYQLTKEQGVTVCKRDRVLVEESRDGSIKIKLRGKPLNCCQLPERPKKTNGKTWVIAGHKKTSKPAADHPWRKFQFGSKHLTPTK